MAYSTDIKDYYRRAWGLKDRVPFKYGGTWADWKTNFSEQMSFEEYLQDDKITKKLHALDRKAKGGRIRGAGPLLLAPVVAPGLAQALGITIGGLGAWAGAQKVQNYIEENPEHAKKVWSVLDPNTAIASTLEGIISKFIAEVHGGKGPIPVDPPETFPAEDTWDKSFKDEGLTIPTEEKIKVPDSIPPQIKTEPEGFPIPEQKGWQEYVSYYKDQAEAPDVKTKEEVIEETEATRENLGAYITLNNLTRLRKFPHLNPGYSLSIPGEGVITSTDLNVLKKKRDNYFEKLKKEQGGFVDHQTFIDLIKSKGMKIGKEDQSDSPATFAKRFNIKIKTVGNKIVYDISGLTDERLEKIRRRRASKAERVKVAKQLIEEKGIKTRASLNRALEEAGYQMMGKEVLDIEFPNLIGQSWSEKEIQEYYGKKAQEKRKEYLDAYSGTGAEEAIIRIKRTLGYGKTVNLMHRKQKTKLVGTGQLDVSDVLLGSYEENTEYNDLNLEKVRNSFNTTQNQLRKKYTKADLNKKVDVSKTMQKRLKLPKTLILKDYIDKINMGVDELSSKTSGKVDGYIFDTKAWKFMPNPISHVNILDVPGLGILEGDLRKYDWLKDKLKWKYPVKKGKKGKKQSARLALDESGMPIIKKGVKLTTEEADDIILIFENLKRQLSRAEKSKPVKIEYAKGGLAGVDQYILNRYA